MFLMRMSFGGPVGLGTRPLGFGGWHVLYIICLLSRYSEHKQSFRDIIKLNNETKIKDKL